MADDHDDDGVGYGRPPKHTRWQPGQSGNPRGRKKGARGLKHDLAAELDSQFTIRMNNEPVTATKQRLMLKSLATRAAMGDTKAAALLLQVTIEVLGVEDRGGGRAKMSAQDEAILRDIMVGEGGVDGANGGELPDLRVEDGCDVSDEVPEVSDD